MGEPSRALPKAPTGIAGLDEVTEGGLPRGRVSLACGGPGCGKTVLAVEFLVRGILDHGEPGVLLSFEESLEDLAANFRGFGHDLPALIADGRLAVLHLDLASEEVREAGDYSLDGLRILLEQAITRIGARRVAIDTLESLFSTLAREDLLRVEVRRLFRWLGEVGVTSIVTAERGASRLTRHGFEEHVSDFVALLDHRVRGNVSKRRLRVVKYRGSAHGADEYPFLIGSSGISVLPVTSVNVEHDASEERVSTGVADLDDMLDGGGYFRGSTVLVSGTAGTGKSSLAAAFAEAACRRGERCLYFAFEESGSQVVRNMRSIGIDLASPLEAGLLTLKALRPTAFGLEEHLVEVLAAVEAARPHVVVMDPISNFLSVGTATEVKVMLVRAFDGFRNRDITCFVTSLIPGSGTPEETAAGVSSIMDTWIALRHAFVGERRACWMHLVKSRGMDHSRERRELIMSSEGLSLLRAPEPPGRVGAQ